MKNLLFILFGILFVGCVSTNFPLSSSNAPKPGDFVSDFQVDTFLTNIGVPRKMIGLPVLDSMPNRSYYGSMSLVFRKNGPLLNTIMCNADYPKIHKSIAYFDNPTYWYPDHTLKDELKSVRGISYDSLPETDYYMVYYWSLVTDNLARRNISALEKLRKSEVSLTVIYVNMNNREEYGFKTSKEFYDFRINKRNMMENYDQDYYFKRK